MFHSVQEIEAFELSEWLEAETRDFRIVDVRETPEHRQGLVPGAVTLPLATLPLRMNEFSPQEKLVFVCRSGARSAQACLFLQQYGFENVYNLRGGMISWAGSNLPIEAHTPA
jgi:rhodanese-related sulfurtransferase